MIALDLPKNRFHLRVVTVITAYSDAFAARFSHRLSGCVDGTRQFRSIPSSCLASHLSTPGDVDRHSVTSQRSGNTCACASASARHKGYPVCSIRHDYLFFLLIFIPDKSTQLAIKRPPPIG